MNPRLLLAPVALAVLAGCTPYTVKFDYDTHANYAQYKSYDWYAASRKAQGKSDGFQDPIMDRRVRGAVERAMAAKGFKMEKQGEPDFLLTYYPVYTRGVAMTTTSMGFGRPWGYGMGTQFTEARPYHEGSIVLEIVDNKTNTLFWRAVAEGALTGLDNPEDAEDQVNAAVNAMLAKFPPPTH